jgi:hypothetical protein
MMLNLNGSINLGKDIYVYPNFISKEERLAILEDIKSITEEKWFGHFNEGSQGAETAHIPLDKFIPINKRLSEMLDSDVYLGSSLSATRMKKGWVGPHHTDNFDFLDVIEASQNLKEGEDFDIAENSIAGLIMYLNDFEGGEIYYSNQDVTYYPKPGDLVIHSSQEHCRHQVQKVLSDIRYSHSSHLFNLIKVPKGFKNVT